MNKKIISLLLTVILIVSTVVTVSAYTVWQSSDTELAVTANSPDESAFGESNAMITTGGTDYTVSSGEIYIYEYHLNIGRKLTSIDATLDYDSDALSLVSYSFPKLKDVISNLKQGSMRIVYANSTGVSFDSDSDVLIRAKFKVKKAGGPHPIQLTIKDMSRYQQVRIVDNGETLASYDHSEQIIDSDDSADVYIHADNTDYKVRPGHFYLYTYYLKTDSRVAALSARISYNNSALQYYPDSTLNQFPVTGSNTRFSNDSLYKGSLSMYYNSVSGVRFSEGDPVMIQVVFRVITNRAGVYPITMDISKLNDENEDPISEYAVRSAITPYTSSAIENEPEIEFPTEEPTEVPSEPPTDPRETEAPTEPPTDPWYTEPPTEYASSSPHSSGDRVIYFDAASAGWNDGERIMLYLYDPSGVEEEFIPWGSHKIGGMTDEGNGIFSFDLEAKGIVLQSGKQYCLIFNHNGFEQTHDLLFDESCYGDTAYVIRDTYIENPYDSNKVSLEARWRSGKLGPMKCITSIGNVVGEVVPALTSPYKIYVDFLSDSGRQSLTNAMNFSGNRSVQQIMDDIASALGLDKNDVENAVSEANAISPSVRTYTSEWKKAASTLPESSETSEGGLVGDVDGDGKVTIYDASAIQRHLAGMAVSVFITEVADADGDGKITIYDASAIQRYLAGMPANAAIGKFLRQ